MQWTHFWTHRNDFGFSISSNPRNQIIDLLHGSIVVLSCTFGHVFKGPSQPLLL